MPIALPVVCGRSCPCGCPQTEDLLLKRGSVLYRQGEPAARLYFVRHGTVMLTHAGADGEEVARGVGKDGGFVGLESLDLGVYADTAVVMTTTMLCAVDKDAFVSWLGPEAGPVRVAFMQLLEQARRTAPAVAPQHGDATRRVARWLVTTAAAEQRVPRRHIATLLGMVPETLSRALARLDDEGLITVSRRGVRVLDAAALRRRAGVDQPAEVAEAAEVAAP